MNEGDLEMKENVGIGRLAYLGWYVFAFIIGSFCFALLEVARAEGSDVSQWITPRIGDAVQ